jgi:hypothetical protein
LGSPTTSCPGFALAGQIATLTAWRREVGEIDLDHPGELDGGGCCFLLRIPWNNTDMTATAERLLQPMRVMDLKLKVDIQVIKGKEKEQRRRPRA